MNLVFLDEAAIWLTQPNTYSWRPIRCPMAVPTSKARGITARLNLMGCVTYASGAVQYREIHGNTSGGDTKQFLDTLAEQADPACPTVVIADRASIHTCKLVCQERERWKRCGLIVVHLPPYSPELNPMEGAWRHLKYHALTSRSFEDKEALRAAVMAADWGHAI